MLVIGTVTLGTAIFYLFIVFSLLLTKTKNKTPTIDEISLMSIMIT